MHHPPACETTHGATALPSNTNSSPGCREKDKLVRLVKSDPHHLPEPAVTRVRGLPTDHFLGGYTRDQHSWTGGLLQEVA